LQKYFKITDSAVADAMLTATDLVNGEWARGPPTESKPHEPIGIKLGDYVWDTTP